MLGTTMSVQEVQMKEHIPTCISVLPESSSCTGKFLTETGVLVSTYEC